MRLARSISIGVLCLVLAGCTGSPKSEESGSGPSVSVSPSREAGDLSVESVVLDDVRLKATVHPIERLDDHVVLTIDFAYAEGSESYSEVDVLSYLRTDQPFPGMAVTGTRLVDFAGSRVWEAGWFERESGFWKSATTGDSLKLRERGDTATSVTYFGPLDVDSVDVLIPKFGVVSRVPVVEGDSGTADQASLNLNSDVVQYHPPFKLESLMRAYGGGPSAQKQGDEQTVVMASDVLFATDSADLSAEAGARVDEVAGQIAAVASGGKVHVVGHTDDVLSQEYNLDLSKRRAASVADRMSGVLGSSFTVTEDGKGKLEPAVDGTDDAARAANRRVEIAFTAPKAVELTPADLPEATGPVGTGHDAVTYTADNSVVYSVEVPSVVRRDGYLVGTFVVNHISGESLNATDFLSVQTPYSQQNEYSVSVGSQIHSARNVVLMSPQGAMFPARYWKEDSDSGPKARLLADETLAGGSYLKVGYQVTYTVIWPDTGEESVTVESLHRFRITDIPVEEG